MPGDPWVSWRCGAWWRLASIAGLVLALSGTLQAETWEHLDLGLPLDRHRAGQDLPGLQPFPTTDLLPSTLGPSGSTGRSPVWQISVPLARLDSDRGGAAPTLTFWSREARPDRLSPLLPLHLTTEGLRLTSSLALVHEVDLATEVSLTPHWQLAFTLPTSPVHRIGHVARPLLVHASGREAMTPRGPGGHQELGAGDLRLQSFYTVPAPRSGAPALGLFGQLRFPTGSQASQLGVNGIDSLGLLTASWQIGRLIPYAHFGGARLAGSPSADLLYGAGLELEVRRGLRLALDGFGRWTFSERHLQEHTVDLGLTWTSIRPFAVHGTFQWPGHQAPDLRTANAWTLRIESPF
jgi:hypothetical protein